MENNIQNQETIPTLMKKKRHHLHRRSSCMAVSFSAELPEDVHRRFHDRIICAVKYSDNPFFEIRESIVEIMENLGIRDWEEMEELAYCYVALNSVQVRGFIVDAFLSLRLSSYGDGDRECLR